MTTTLHDHWRDVPESAWRWPDFSPAEIACRGSGALLINEPALDRLQALRDRLGKPLIVRSNYLQPRAQISMTLPRITSPRGMDTVTLQRRRDPMGDGVGV